MRLPCARGNIDRAVNDIWQYIPHRASFPNIDSKIGCKGWKAHDGPDENKSDLGRAQAGT